MARKTYFDAEKKIWSGPERNCLFQDNASVGEVLEYSMKQHFDRVSQICFDDGSRWTFKEVHHLSRAIAFNLLKLNLSQDDVVGICAYYTPYLSPLILGCLYAAIPFSPTDPSFDVQLIKHVYGITKPKVMFCDRELYEKSSKALQELGLNIPIYIIDELNGQGTLEEFLKAPEDGRHFQAASLKYGGHQVACILCSSGTTGLPKGVAVSHWSIINARCGNSQAGDVHVCFNSVYWIGGILSYTDSIINGATRVIVKQFTADTFIDIVEKMKVIRALTNPVQLYMLTESPRFYTADLSSLKTFIVGGSPILQELYNKFKNQLESCQFVVGYGMTELAGALTAGLYISSGCVGTICDSQQVRIIDNDGKSLGIGEVGEILIRDRFKWGGYYENKKATDECFIDGWLHSGDLGYFDSTGNLFLVERKKDLLKYNLFHYYPTEIEQVIGKLPDVKEVCVCGIFHPKHMDLPAAAIVKAEGSKLTEQEVYDHVANNLSDYMKLRGGVYFIDKIPKTPSGKNQRRATQTIVVDLYNSRNTVEN